MLRSALVITFGLLPSLTLFWWMFHGCAFASFPPTSEPFTPAEWRPLWNAALFLTFGFVHSALAEAGINRLAYIVIAGITSLAVIALWQPSPGVLWQLGDADFAWFFGTVQFILWLAFHTWTVSQFGLRGFLGQEEPTKRLITSGPYKWIRSPMNINILVHLLITPAMTADRLTLLAAVAIYLAAAIPMEEARLSEVFGLEWRAYKAKTPLLIPFTKGWPS